MTAPADALRRRYTALLSRRPPELAATLHALRVHPSDLAIPAPHPLAQAPPAPAHLFDAFGFAPLVAASPSASAQIRVPCVDAPLGVPILQSILRVAGAARMQTAPPSQTPPASPPHPTSHPPAHPAIAHHHQHHHRVNASPLPLQRQQPQTPPPAPNFDFRRHPARVPRDHRPQPHPQLQPQTPSPPPPSPPAAPAPQNPFRTARSRLPSKRLLRPNARPNAAPSPDSAAMVATRAVLGSGPKRPRLNARSTRPQPDDRGAAGPDVPEVPNVEPRLVEMIMNEMLDRSPGVDWADIAGLHFAKRCVMEAVVWPMQRPDIFTGLRGPPKGLLLFGPPGTGKTLIGRAIASKSGAKFFNISASSLMSKWVGEGEKMVRALFAVAREFQVGICYSLMHHCTLVFMPCWVITNRILLCILYHVNPSISRVHTAERRLHR